MTAMRDQVSWGFYIGNFTFLVGVAAAAVVLVIPVGAVLVYRARELHLPALTIPAFKGPRGLPIGPQLIGKWSDDRRLIAAAKWIVARLT